MTTGAVVLTADRALEIIDQALAHVTGNRETHQALALSVQAVKARLEAINIIEKAQTEAQARIDSLEGELEAAKKIVLGMTFTFCEVHNCTEPHFHTTENPQESQANT